MEAGIVISVIVSLAIFYVAGKAFASVARGVSSLFGGKKLRPVSTPAVAPAFVWPTLDEFSCDIVGESHYQPHLARLAGDHGAESAHVPVRAMLVPEPDNQYDSNAVRVEVGGKPVGYLGRDDAAAYHRRLKKQGRASQAAECGAVVMGGFVDRRGNRASYGVRLDIAPFD